MNRHRTAPLALLALLASPLIAQPTDDVVADWDNDGDIDAADRTSFITDLLGNDTATDLNEDGSYTAADTTLFDAVHSGNRLPDGVIAIYIPATGNLEEDVPMLSPWSLLYDTLHGNVVWDSVDLVNMGEVFEYDSSHDFNDSGNCSWCASPSDDYWDEIPGRAMNIKTAYEDYYWEAVLPEFSHDGGYRWIAGHYTELVSSDDDFDSGNCNMRLWPDLLLIGYPSISELPPGAPSGEYDKLDGLWYGANATVPIYLDEDSFEFVASSSVTDNGDGTYTIDNPSGTSSLSALLWLETTGEDYEPVEQVEDDDDPKKWDPDLEPFRYTWPITLTPDYTPGLRDNGNAPSTDDEVWVIDADAMTIIRDLGCDGPDWETAPGILPVTDGTLYGDEDLETCLDELGPNIQFEMTTSGGNEWCFPCPDSDLLPVRSKRYGLFKTCATIGDGCAYLLERLDNYLQANWCPECVQ